MSDSAARAVCRWREGDAAGATERGADPLLGDCFRIAGGGFRNWYDRLRCQTGRVSLVVHAAVSNEAGV